MEKILKRLLIMAFLLPITALANSAVIKIPLHAATVTLDPSGIEDISSLFVSRQVNCQLVRSYGSVTTLEAAESIRFINSKKIIVTIKKTATFHDGSPITAEDLIASFDYIKKSRNVLRNVFTWTQDIEAIDKNKIAITLKKPIPQFLRVLSSPNYAIFKKSFLESAKKNPDLWKAPQGCGNYKVVEHTDKIIKLIPIKEGRPVQFYLGTKDQLNGDELDQYDISDLQLVEASSHLNEFNKINFFDPTQIFLGLNTTLPYWKNKENRCKFLSKLNAKPIIDTYGEIAKPASDILPQGILGYKHDRYVYSPGKESVAKKNHFCLSYLTVSIPEKYRYSYLEMVNKIYPSGPTINFTNNKHFGSDFLKSQCDAIIVGLKSNTLDGYDILAVFSESDPNFTGFSNKKISAEIENSQNEADPYLRSIIYRHIISELNQNCLVYPILTLPTKTIYVRKTLKTPNIGKSPLNEYYLGQVE